MRFHKGISKVFRPALFKQRLHNGGGLEEILSALSGAVIICSAAVSNNEFVNCKSLRRRNGHRHTSAVEENCADRLVN